MRRLIVEDERKTAVLSRAITAEQVWDMNFDSQPAWSTSPCGGCTERWATHFH